MKTKKRLALLLMVVLAVSLFAGCGSKEPEKKETQNVEGDTSKEDADKNDGEGIPERKETQIQTQAESSSRWQRRKNFLCG